MKNNEVTCDLTKQKAIDLILKDNDYQINYNLFVDISHANSIEEARDMGESISWGLPDFGEIAVKKFKQLQKEKQRLEKLQFFEVLEIGEEKGLWKQREKQRRLIIQ